MIVNNLNNIYNIFIRIYMEPISTIVSTFIGRQLFSKAITDASDSIYLSVGNIFSYNENIDDVLQYLDIHERIKTIDLLIKDIKEYNNTISHCVLNLHDIILLIREDLKQINILIENHKDKYFSSWRFFDCKKQLKNLKLHSQILDKRLDYLIKALDIMDFSTKTKNKVLKKE